MSKGNCLSAREIKFLHGTPYRATSQLKIFQFNFPCTVIKQFPVIEMRHARRRAVLGGDATPVKYTLN